MSVTENLLSQHRRLGKTGVSIPCVGLGAWGIGGLDDRDDSRDVEGVSALRLGLDLGMSLIDTAEMYAAGHSEELVGQVLRERADDVFVASKVTPDNFAYENVLRSAHNSLKRLGLKQMDLYQLHWYIPNIPLSETMRAMEKLVNDGLVRFIGVSNFNVAQMKEAQSHLSRAQIVSNQVEYSLLDRSVEREVIPYCRREGITVMAYSPLAHGKIPNGDGERFTELDAVASKLGRSRSQVALNWLLQDSSVVIIPKAIRTDHVRENAQVWGWSMDSELHGQLGRLFS